MTCSVESLKWFCRCWRWKWGHSHLAREVKFKTAMTLTPWLLLMCGLDVNNTLFPGGYSLTSLPKPSFFISHFCVSVWCVPPFGVISLPSVAGNFGKLDNDSSLKRSSQSVLVAHGMWSSHCPGYTSHSHKAFLGQRCLCLHIAANCNAQTERCYFWWQVTSYLHMGTCSYGTRYCSLPCELFSLTSAWLWKKAAFGLLYRLKQPHNKLFKLGSHLLFVFFHQAVMMVIIWNFSLWSLQRIHQNLDIESCDCGALLDVLPSLSLVTGETKKFMLHHGMFFFTLYMLKGHSSFAGPLELRSPFCRCLLIPVLLRHTPYFRSLSR